MSKLSENRRKLGGGDGLAANNLTNRVRQIGRIFSHIAIFGLIFSVFLTPQESASVELKQRQFGAGLQSPGATGATGATGAYGGYVEEVPGTAGMSEMEVISTLRHDIQLLDEELRTCEKKRKGWVAATIVGGVGVVGTGVAALVQNSNIQEKKRELGKVTGEIKDTKASIEEAQSKLQ